MRALILLASASVALVSCSASPEDVGAMGSLAARNPIFAAQLAGPSTFIPPLPTALVVLEPGDLNRNRAFCTAMDQLPTARQALAGSIVAPNLILTRWPVQLTNVSLAQALDCDFLVGAYDYSRLARLRRSIRLSEGSLSGPGPFLLMFIPDGTGVHVAGLDGSAFSEADFPRFIASWTSSLHQAELGAYREPDRPGLVRSVFDLISAILRTAAGATTGLIRGVFVSL